MCMIVHVVHPPFQWLHCKNVRLCVQVGCAYWFAKGGSTRLAVTEALATPRDLEDFGSFSVDLLRIIRDLQGASFRSATRRESTTLPRRYQCLSGRHSLFSRVDILRYPWRASCPQIWEIHHPYSTPPRQCLEPYSSRSHWKSFGSTTAPPRLSLYIPLLCMNFEMLLALTTSPWKHFASSLIQSKNPFSLTTMIVSFLVRLLMIGNLVTLRPNTSFCPRLLARLPCMSWKRGKNGYFSIIVYS